MNASGGSQTCAEEGAVDTPTAGKWSDYYTYDSGTVTLKEGVITSVKKSTEKEPSPIREDL